jgi:exonuclease SbcC
MIPLKLSVKNFMCYRDDVPTLDLEGIHVACLCGDNGHGKSALLDGITWALWGRARASTQDELVHQGMEDMAVELEFSARDQRYRVSRRYSRRGKSGSTILELQVSGGDGFQPITGNSVRDTEARIRDLLHMDYDTFINTAFLLQGRADEFTKASPSKRKEVLAEVLDLSHYETLEERAKGRSQSARDGIANADTAIELRRQELTRRPEHETQLATVSALLERLGPELSSGRDRADTLRDRVGALKTRGQEMDGLERHIGDRRREISDLEQRERTHGSAVATFEELMDREPEVRRQYAALEAARTDLDRLAHAAFGAAGLEEERARLAAEVAVQRERLSSRVAELRRTIEDDLEPRAQRLPEIKVAYAAVTTEQAGLDELESGIAKQREESREISQDLERLARALDLKNGLDSQRAEIQQDIAVQKARLVAERNQLHQRIQDDLRPKAESLTAIEQEVNAAAIQEQELGRQAETVRQRRREAEEMDGRIGYLRQTNKDLLTEMADSRDKYDMLMAQDTTQCPLCKQPLGPEGTAHLEAEYKEQGLDQKLRYQHNADEEKSLVASHSELTDLVRSLDGEREEKQRDAQAKAAAANRGLEEARAARLELDSLAPSLTKLDDDLAAGRFALDARAGLERLDAELATLAYDPERRTAVQERASQVSERLAELERELSEGRSGTGNRATTLWADLQDSRRAQGELEPRRTEFVEVQRVIEAQGYAREERARLADLDRELAALGYDRAAHEEVQRRARELEPFAEQYRQLEEARDALPGERSALETVRQTLERQRGDLASDETRRETLATALLTLPALESEMARARGAFEDLERQEQTARVDERLHTEQLRRLAETEMEIGRREKGRRELAERKSIYDELTVAFGKNGIQALIIEAAIPQLQDDANELLGRLTDNRMFLKLQVQEGRRERRIGIPSEELDIKISDEVGTRSYETFSGGEAFRINFALRIALSKLLARRSGAPLPILFIDEGFGSQDTAGQDRLREAIQSIQSDFEKIIVITHIEQIKESFPNRIEVVKTPNGSTFVVV